MKPAYYPHITLLAAAFITIAPLCLVLALPSLRSSEDAELESFVEESGREDTLPSAPDADSDVAVPVSSTPVAASAPTPEEFQTEPVAPEPVIPPLPKSRPLGPVRSETEIAERPSTENGATGVSDLTTPQYALSPTAITDNMAPQEFPGVADSTVAIAAEDTMQNSPASTHAVPLPDTVASVDPADTGTPVMIPDASSSPRSPANDTPGILHDNADTVDISELPFPEPQIDPPSTFAATGHLSMMDSARGAIAGTLKSIPPSSGDPAMRSHDADLSGSVPASPSEKRPRWTSRRTDQKRTPDYEATSEAARQIAAAPLADGMPAFGVRPEVQLADVILQQPLESRPVDRVENLVAVTQAPGWPIALVRSDLPDDHWWVQQMVGKRGNAFAARVNFGNADSIPGSVYHLVIVFLDSPDEVRRFRIAKQFKELPEGIRHSREYTFVRR